VRDRSFGPVVVLGLAAGTLAAVAGSRDWVEVEAQGPDEALLQAWWTASPGLAQMPLSGALGLVVLACWGVLLVTRGRWRRVVAVAGTVASLGLVATWVSALVDLQDRVVERLEPSGATFGDPTWTTWFWVAAPAALLAVATFAVAVRRAPRWPAMGSRYDAPTRRPDAESPAQTPVQDQDPTAVWKALDEGRDPTRDPAP